MVANEAISGVLPCLLRSLMFKKKYSIKMQPKIAMLEHEAPIATKMGERALSLGIPRYREDRGPLRSTLMKND